MKRFLALLLAMTSISLVFSACDSDENVDEGSGTKNKIEEVDGELKFNGKSVYEAYSESRESIKKLTNFEYNLVQKQALSLSGTNIEYLTTQVGKINGNSVEATVTSNIPGMTNSTVIFADDWYYVVTDSVSTSQKANISYSELALLLYGSEASDMFGDYIVAYPESWLSDVELVEDGDEYKCTLSVDGNAYMNQFKDTPYFQKLTGSLQFEMNVDKFDCVIYFDENAVVVKVEQSITFSFEVEGQKGIDVVEQTFEISNVNGVGEIQVPENAADFMDVTSAIKSMLGA